MRSCVLSALCPVTGPTGIAPLDPCDSFPINHLRQHRAPAWGGMFGEGLGRLGQPSGEQRANVTPAYRILGSCWARGAPLMGRALDKSVHRTPESRRLVQEEGRIRSPGNLGVAKFLQMEVGFGSRLGPSPSRLGDLGPVTFPLRASGCSGSEAPHSTHLSGCRRAKCRQNGRELP